MKLLKNYRRELIYLCFHVLMASAVKSLDGIAVSVFYNICTLYLSFWYWEKSFSLKIDFSFILQIVHGLWSAITMLVINLVMCYVCFGIHTTFVFQMPDRSPYIFHLLFLGLIAITEELEFRVCFYNIFEKLHMHKLLIIIEVSLLFGLEHLYMNGIFAQCISTIIFSLLLFFFLYAIDRYTIVSCISAHFIYRILCDYLVYS